MAEIMLSVPAVDLDQPMTGARVLIGHHDTTKGGTHDFELHTANLCHGGAAGCIRLRCGS